jgi:hypothetical protein
MLTELEKYYFVNLPPAKLPAKTRRRLLYRTIRKLSQRLSARAHPFLKLAPSIGIELLSAGVALLVAAIVMAYVTHTISLAAGDVLAEISLPPVLAGSILWAAALIHPDFPYLSATQMVGRVALGYALFFGGLWTLAAYNLLPDPDQPFAISGLFVSSVS